MVLATILLRTQCGNARQSASAPQAQPSPQHAGQVYMSTPMAMMPAGSYGGAHMYNMGLPAALPAALPQPIPQPPWFQQQGQPLASEQPWYKTEVCTAWQQVCHPSVHSRQMPMMAAKPHKHACSGLRHCPSKPACIITQGQCKLGNNCPYAHHGEQRPQSQAMASLSRRQAQQYQHYCNANRRAPQQAASSGRSAAGVALPKSQPATPSSAAGADARVAATQAATAAAKTLSICKPEAKSQVCLTLQPPPVAPVLRCRHQQRLTAASASR